MNEKVSICQGLFFNLKLKNHKQSQSCSGIKPSCLPDVPEMKQPSIYPDWPTAGSRVNLGPPGKTGPRICVGDGWEEKDGSACSTFLLPVQGLVWLALGAGISDRAWVRTEIWSTCWDYHPASRQDVCCTDTSQAVFLQVLLLSSAYRWVVRLRPREVEWFAQGHSVVVLGFSQPLSGWLESPGMVFSTCSTAPWVRGRQNSSLRALYSRSRAFYVCVRLPAQGVFLLFYYQIQFQNVYCSRKLGIIIANITEHLPGVRRCPKRLKTGLHFLTAAWWMLLSPSYRKENWGLKELCDVSQLMWY